MPIVNTSEDTLNMISFMVFMVAVIIVIAVGSSIAKKNRTELKVITVCSQCQCPLPIETNP